MYLFWKSVFFILEDNKYGDDVTVQGALENIYVLCIIFFLFIELESDILK